MIVSKRMTIVDKENIKLDLEYNEDFAILHLPYLKLTKSSYIDFVWAVEDLHELFTTMGYDGVWTAVLPEDKTVAKLVGRVGGVKMGHSEGYDVYRYGGEL